MSAFAENYLETPEDSARPMRRLRKSLSTVAFSVQHSRFVTLRQFADPRPELGMLADDLRANFAGGVCFPLDCGETNSGGSFLTEELPEGCSLRALMDANDPPGDEALLDLARALLSQTRQALDGYGLNPVLEPESVFVQFDQRGEPRVVFPEYDWVTAEDADRDLEVELIQGISLLLRFAAGGARREFFYDLLGDAFTPDVYPKLSARLRRMLQDLFSEDLYRRPESFARFEQLLDETGQMTQPTRFDPKWKVPEQLFGNWITPPMTVVNRLSTENRSERARTFAIPAEELTGGAFRRGIEVAEARAAATGRGASWLVGVRTVSEEAGWTLVFEDRDHSVSLAEILLARATLERDEAVGLLEKLHAALKGLESVDLAISCPDPRDILLTPWQTPPNGRADEFDWLAEPESYELRLRPYPSDCFAGSTPELATLTRLLGSGDDGDRWRSRIATTDCRFVAIAYRIAKRAAAAGSAGRISSKLARFLRSSLEIEDAGNPERRELVTGLIRDEFPKKTERAAMRKTARQKIIDPNPDLEFWRPRRNRRRFVLSGGIAAAAAGLVGLLLVLTLPNQDPKEPPPPQYRIASATLPEAEVTPALPLSTPVSETRDPTLNLPTLPVAHATPAVPQTLPGSEESPEVAFTSPPQANLPPEPPAARVLAAEVEAPILIPVEIETRVREPRFETRELPPEVVLVSPQLTHSPAIDLAELAEIDRRRAAEKEQQLLASAAENRLDGNWAGAAEALNQALPEVAENRSEPVTEEITRLVEAIDASDLHRMPKKVIELFERATLQRHPAAASLLARWSAASDQPDSDDVVKWNQVAAELGDTRAMTRVGLAQAKPGSSEENLASAVSWLEKAAGAGETDAAYFLGECYLFGKGVERSPERAVQLFVTAHEAGDSKATLMLGTCYTKGIGVARDFREALKYFQQAIERGNDRAYGNLGIMHLKAQGVPFNPELAVRLLRQGAERDDPVAAYYLGKCLEEGVGLEADDQAAREWYVASARGGFPLAVMWCEERAIDIGEADS